MKHFALLIVMQCLDNSDNTSRNSDNELAIVKMNLTWRWKIRLYFKLNVKNGSKFLSLDSKLKMWSKTKNWELDDDCGELGTIFW